MPLEGGGGGGGGGDDPWWLHVHVMCRHTVVQAPDGHYSHAPACFPLSVHCYQNRWTLGNSVSTQKEKKGGLGRECLHPSSH